MRKPCDSFKQLIEGRQARTGLVKSGFNTWALRRMVGNQNDLPTNRICEALGAKLVDVILDVGKASPDL